MDIIGGTLDLFFYFFLVSNVLNSQPIVGVYNYYFCY